MKAGALAGPTFFADDLPQPLQFLRHLLVSRDDGIERVGNFPCQSRPGDGEANGKISIPHGLQAGENHAEIGSRRLNRRGGISIAFTFVGLRLCAGDSNRRILTSVFHGPLPSYSEGILCGLPVLAGTDKKGAFSRDPPRRTFPMAIRYKETRKAKTHRTTLLYIRKIRAEPSGIYCIWQ